MGMDLNNIPLMVALKKRMTWLNANQTVLSENVSNADTPGYKAKGLDKQDFSSLVDGLESGNTRRAPTVGMRTSKVGHIDTSGGTGSGAYQSKDLKNQEESPTGNTVILEEEMMKVADNQMKYGLAVNLYKKNIGLLRMAMGKGGQR